jgi:hypothetical protein
MLSDVNNILEVHAHYELWSFVNGGAEVCSILVLKSLFAINFVTIVCLRPVKGRYVTMTAGEEWTDLIILQMKIYSKCKYICSFKC